MKVNKGYQIVSGGFERAIFQASRRPRSKSRHLEAMPLRGSGIRTGSNFEIAKIGSEPQTESGTDRRERGARARKPVALLSPYRPPLMTAERKKAIQRAIDVMAKGLSWGDALQRFKREEMHESDGSYRHQMGWSTRPARRRCWLAYTADACFRRQSVIRLFLFPSSKGLDESALAGRSLFHR